MKSLQERFSNKKEILSSAVAAASLSAAALFMTGCGTNAEAPAYAYCTGSQEVEAPNGGTLQGMIEAHVETPPEDGLKSTTEGGASGLDILAQGITPHYNGESVSVPRNYAEPAPVGVQAGETYILPTECHSPDEQ